VLKSIVTQFGREPRLRLKTATRGSYYLHVSNQGHG